MTALARPGGRCAQTPDPPPPAVPTEAPPGSPEKIAILAERLAAGVALWHPCDSDAPPPHRRCPTDRLARALGSPTVRSILMDALRGRQAPAVVACRLGCSETHARRLLKQARAECLATTAG